MWLNFCHIRDFKLCFTHINFYHPCFSLDDISSIVMPLRHTKSLIFYLGSYITMKWLVTSQGVEVTSGYKVRKRISCWHMVTIPSIFLLLAMQVTVPNNTVHWSSFITVWARLRIKPMGHGCWSVKCSLIYVCVCVCVCIYISIHTHTHMHTNMCK